MPRTMTPTTVDPVADAEANVRVSEVAVPKAEAAEAEVKRGLEQLLTQQETARQTGGVEAAIEFDEKVAAAERRAKHSAKVVEDRKAELAVAWEILADANETAKAARMMDIARAIIKADQDIDRARLAVGRAVQKRLDLGDKLLAGRSASSAGPTIRQIRGVVHLLPIVLAPLAKLFPRDLSRPHPQLRGTTLAAFERRLFACWLSNGNPDDTNDTPPPAGASAEER